MTHPSTLDIARPITAAALLLAACGSNGGAENAPPGLADAPESNPPAADAGNTVQADPLADPAVPGPHGVGVRTMQATGSRPEPFEVVVWYPAAHDAGSRLYPYGEGALDAPVADGVFPVVLYSHGNAEVPQASLFLMEHLASHGFVVAAPAHRYDTLDDADQSRFMEMTMMRLVDTPATLDRVLAASEDDADPLFEHLDADAVGAIGHSWGAVTVELLAGWKLSVDPDGTVADAALAEGLSWPVDVTDPRIDAGVSIATCVADMFTTAGFDQIGVPMLYMGGTADAAHCVVDDHAALKAEATPEATLVRFEAATHYAFTNMCEVHPTGPYECATPPRPYAEVQRLTSELVTDFLLRELRGDDRYAATLTDSTH